MREALAIDVDSCLYNIRDCFQYSSCQYDYEKRDPGAAPLPLSGCQTTAADCDG